MAAVVRYTADTVEGVRARSCRIVVDPADPYALPIEMTVSLRYGTGPAQDLLDTVRARIGSALRGQVGVRAGAVDLHVVDLWPEGEGRYDHVRHRPARRPVRRPAPRHADPCRGRRRGRGTGRSGGGALQPGLWGLVQQLGTDLWTRATGKPRPDTGGVEVVIDGDTTTIDITVVADGLRPAAVIAAHGQREVHRAVNDSGAAPPTRIAVHIADIALSS